MKRLWILLIIVFILAIVLFVPLVGHHRRKVSGLNPDNFQNRPARIVSLAPNLTEILFALGLDGKIVAVSNGSNYPPEAANKKKIGSFFRPNAEAIIASKPNLVIMLQNEQQKSVRDTLSRFGYQVLTLKIEKIEELLSAIQKIGTATDSKQRADELVENISTQLDDLKSKFSSANKVKVLWVVQTEPLRVAGRNTFINEIIKLAGGENAIGLTISKYPQIGAEKLLVCQAEVIIQSAMGPNIDEQQRAAEAFWSRQVNLPAVRNNKIYVVDSDLALRLGPRLPQGAEMITRCLHPDIFRQTNDNAR
jgi:iron complex transport system substrate-binding protein